MRKSATCRRRCPRGSATGFTLIEVLVVVAIIALLISILLPSLRNAREQAKVVRCLANMSQLAKATSMYLGASKDRFPWGPRYKNGVEVVDGSGNPLTRTWYFGGNRGQNSDSLRGTTDPPGFYTTGSTHDWSPAERPLNKYVYPGAKLTKGDTVADRPLWKPGPLTVFECPSDQGVRWNGDPNSTLKETITAYLEVGTSYQSNNSWGYYVKNREYAPSGAATAKRLRYLMDRIVHILEKRGASRTVLIYEDTADWAFNTTLPDDYKVRSWHNKFDIHNLMFADGHAAPTQVDHRKSRYTVSGNMPYTQYDLDHSGDRNWVVRQFYRDEAQ